MTDTVTLTDNATGKSVELDIKRGTEGPGAFDISRLYNEAGLFTYDPGFMATASCKSAITYIDGEAGILRYRGYPVEELAAHCTFMEVAHLLICGELPDAEHLVEFQGTIHDHMMINESLTKFFQGFRYDSHPMAMMAGVVASLSAFYHTTLDLDNPEHRADVAQRLIAKVGTIAAASYKRNIGEPFMYPQNDLHYCENLLYMMFATPCGPYACDPAAVRALNTLFILHADHEQNASTSTVRLAASSGANPYACIAAGITSLWGPAHGGANEAVLKQLDEIGSSRNIPKYIARAKDKNDPFRLMGFGHRVYKNYDPRAKVIRQVAHEVLENYQGADVQMFDLALELEAIALEDDYFVERKLYPNVDFYSGMIYRALGIPLNMLTVMFAVARTAGWVSHWMEMMNDPVKRIGRPRQVYDGYAKRDFVPMDQRGPAD
ncbi:MAG: citrate synthase [Pseudomonadota bacterium]